MVHDLANPFTLALFSFLRDLAENNEREWFKANKDRYEEDLKDPSLRFISDFGPTLKQISPHFDAIPKAVGGSLFRIYRDVRFSKDKRPYKTHAGIHFRHKSAKDAHAPGFYLHLEPKGCFMGLGIWHPDGPTLKKIRQAIAEDPEGWKAARDDEGLAGFDLAGESLKRPPKGFDADHPLIEDLKRKDFIAVRNLSKEEVLAPGFPSHFAGLCASGAPLARYLCGALGVPF